ncbi:hypothetical protein ILUMI_14854, partial [Ignelater luminosus]
GRASKKGAKSKKLARDEGLEIVMTTMAIKMDKIENVMKYSSRIKKINSESIKNLNEKEEVLSEEFEQMRMDLLAITKTKRKVKGCINLKNGHYMILGGVAEAVRARAGSENETKELKDIFREQLQDEMDQINHKVFIVDDFNGRVESSKENDYPVEPFYQHKKIHKYTQVMNSRNKKPIIDLVSVQNR